MAPRTLPPAEYLHQCLEYEAETGLVRWRHRPREHFATLRAYKTWNARYAGNITGHSKPKGHLYIIIDDVAWQLSRIIYKMHHLTEPKFIDHKDRDPRNNRIDNLRSATLRENNRNKVKAIGASGFTGVIQHGKKRFRARISDGSGKPIYLGMFDTAQEAHDAYRDAANKMFGDFSPFRNK